MLLLVKDRCYPDAVAQALEAADHSSEPILAGIEAALVMAEGDPEGARMALWRLQADWETLGLLDGYLGGEPTRAALRVGAAIQFARAALSSPDPQLRQRLPELLELLASTAEDGSGERPELVA
jgi:hypothetical protein